MQGEMLAEMLAETQVDAVTEGMTVATEADLMTPEGGMMTGATADGTAHLDASLTGINTMTELGKMTIGVTGSVLGSPEAERVLRS